jgi:hypothetical protein
LAPLPAIHCSRYPSTRSDRARVRPWRCARRYAPVNGMLTAAMCPVNGWPRNCHSITLIIYALKPAQQPSCQSLDRKHHKGPRLAQVISRTALMVLSGYLTTLAFLDVFLSVRSVSGPVMSIYRIHMNRFNNSLLACRRLTWVLYSLSPQPRVVRHALSRVLSFNSGRLVAFLSWCIAMVCLITVRALAFNLDGQVA